MTTPFYSTDPKDFTFKKPENWPTLPLYKKINIYKTVLTQHYAPYIDKLQAKQIVKEICGDAIKVAKVVRVLSGPNDIQLSDINTNYMIKSTHASGWNINIKKNTVVPEIPKILNLWNRIFTAAEQEVQYNYLTPKFFIEEKINDIHSGFSGKATVFMIRCIHGVPQSIRVLDGNGIDTSYTPSWELEKAYIRQINNTNKAHQIQLEKPKQLEEMLRLAALLSQPFEFVRIDFYLSKDNSIYFSEFTFTPGGGSQYFSDEKELELGKLWQ
jgi:hypothetical protein